MKEGGTVTQCEIPYRKDEKYWITAPEPGSASFYISFNFGNPQDISMARIMLLEFKETTRHVKGSVSITYHDRGAPQELTAVFPNTGRETYTNGILQISKSFFYLCLSLIFYVGYRNAKVPCLGSNGHHSALDIHYKFPPVHRLPFALNEAVIAQENAQASRSIRTRHYSGKARPYWHQKLEGVAHWHWRGWSRARRRKEAGRSLHSHKVSTHHSKFCADNRN